MISSSEQFATMAAIALAFENSGDVTLLPEKDTLVDIVRDPHTPTDNLQIALHLLSLHNPTLSSTETQHVKFAVQRLAKATTGQLPRRERIAKTAQVLGLL